MNLRRSAIFLLWLAVPLGAAADGQPTGIHVTGHGRVDVTPDMARLTLEVTREGQDAAALKSAVDRVTGQVLELCRSLGIEREDVTAAAVNIQPRYRRQGDNTVIDGVQVTRSINVVLRNLDGYGKLLNGALETGVNAVSGTSLDSSRREALEREALDLAIADAERQARRTAERFGVGLGTLTTVHVSFAPGPPQPMARFAMMEGAGGDFSPGQLTVERTVQATYAITDN